jgi:hypothetical protein
MRICLKLPNDYEPAHVARLSYAFRLFCAIYGHTPLLDVNTAKPCDVVFQYGNPSFSSARDEAPTVWLSPFYRPRDPREPAPAPVPYTSSGVKTVLHYPPGNSDAPDWLAEIFEWVSCADEYSVSRSDSVGRPVFAATYLGRHGLDTTIPYAALAMRFLQLSICRAVPRAAESPRSMGGNGTHLVVPTHDVDYFPGGRLHAARRLLRNALISLLLTRQGKLGMQQAVMAVNAMLHSGLDPLNQIGALAREERQRGMSATYYFLARHAHRRDAGYTLENREVLEAMRWLKDQDMEIGIHGTYTSLDHPHGLESEVAAMAASGFRPCGGRQHWLRYTLDRLIPAIQRAGLDHDASIGWHDRIGFRAGACFAFPPYDFQKESAAEFLEIPLVVMDQALQPQSGGLQQMFARATEVMEGSARLGWGGISLLWHPAAFGNGWLSREVGDMFWTLAKGAERRGENWISASNFVDRAWHRYADAGLLPANKPTPMLEDPVIDRNDKTIEKLRAEVGPSRQLVA